jgi:membrane glycosyltransferase
MLMLFLPKALSVIAAVRRPAEASRFGGRGKLVLSAALEVAGSTLIAPINMIFNAKFVLFTFLGEGVTWIAQRRGAGEDGTGAAEAVLTHGVQTAIGLGAGALTLALLPGYFPWLSPVLAGLALSIPISMLFSKESLGQRAREMGIFVTPEEAEPPRELADLRRTLAECYRHLPPIEPLRADYGLMQAVLDPYINAMHVALLRQRRTSDEVGEWFAQLRQRLLREGPAGFSTREKMALLLDPDSMIWLHRELWTRPSGALAEWWRLAIRQYNVLTATPTTALYR